MRDLLSQNHRKTPMFLIFFFERLLSTFALKEPPLYGKTNFQAFLSYCLVIQYISFKFLSSSMSALFWDSKTCTRFSRHCKQVQIKYLCFEYKKFLYLSEMFVSIRIRMSTFRVFSFSRKIGVPIIINIFIYC